MGEWTHKLVNGWKIRPGLLGFHVSKQNKRTNNSDPDRPWALSIG